MTRMDPESLAGWACVGAIAGLAALLFAMAGAILIWVGVKPADLGFWTFVMALLGLFFRAAAWLIQIARRP